MEWRTFCAFELPAALRAQLEDHIGRLSETVTDVRASWSRPENTHLTLKFFGNVPVEKLPQISAAAEQASKQFSAIRIEVGKTGVFPNVNRARVLWIGVHDPSGELGRLQRMLEEQFEIEGFPKEERAFKPHLTIARIRTPEGARQLAEAHMRMHFKASEITLKELVVFRSEPSSKGSKYTPISTNPLSHKRTND
jgi:RNA 2',3'-cyclic 3'-phosphodiesterase